jgi:hypothetical protein
VDEGPGADAGDVGARLGHRLVTEEDDRVAAACRAEVVALQDERDTLAREVARLAAAQEEQPPDRDALASLAEEAVKRLEDVLAGGSPPEVRAALGDIIDRVELFFAHDRTGPTTKTTFARGLIYVRDDSPLSPCLEGASA